MMYRLARDGDGAIASSVPTGVGLTSQQPRDRASACAISWIAASSAARADIGSYTQIINDGINQYIAVGAQRAASHRACAPLPSIRRTAAHFIVPIIITGRAEPAKTISCIRNARKPW